jgi:hypothetical protein
MSQKDTPNKIVNGVNATQLFETIDIIKKKIMKLQNLISGKKTSGLVEPKIKQLFLTFMVHARPTQELNPMYLQKMNLRFFWEMTRAQIQ